MKKYRMDSIDIAKGIGILLVVFAHTLVPQLRNDNAVVKSLWIFIYNFHMPLFFFLSGWLFEKGLHNYTNKGKFIAGKLKFLMLPYITFSVFAYALINIAMHISKLASILGNGGYSAVAPLDAAFQILTYNNHADQHLWFVFSLFILFLINILIPKIMKSKPMLILLLALYVSKAFIHYYGIFDYTASDLFFFSLARVMFSEEKRNFALTPLKFIITAAIFICTNCVYSYFYVTQMPDGIIKAMLYIIRSISSVAGIMTVCAIASYIENKKASRPLKELGMYSYDIYLIHAPFLVSGSMGIALSFTKLPPFVCCGAVLVIGICVPYIISKFIIRKVPALSVLVLGKNHTKSKEKKFTNSKSI